MADGNTQSELEALSPADIFQEAKERLEIAQSAQTKNRPRAKEDMLFREGDQWEPDVTQPSATFQKPQLVINITDSVCQRILNNIKLQRPRPKAHPVGDGADVERAEVINGILRHIDERSTASVAYDQAADSAITAGEGYFRLISEYEHDRSFRKELRLVPIRNIFTVFMDPAAQMPAGEDQGWCLLSGLMRRSEFRRRYPHQEGADWRSDGTHEHQDWEDEEFIRLAEYFRIVHRPEKLHRLRDKGGNEYTLFESELPSESKLREFGLRKDGDRQSLRRVPQWFRLNGLKVVDRQELPGRFIPVFRVEGNRTDIDGEVTTRGAVRFLRDPQKMINYAETSGIMRLGLAPKAPWVAAQGQIDGHDEWHNANTRAYSVLTYNPITVSTAQGDALLPPPQRQPPAQVEAGFAEYRQGMIQNLLMLAGQPHDPGMDKGSEVVSGIALRRRAAMSDQSHYHYFDNLTLAQAHYARVALEWVPVTYSEPNRLQRIIGEDTKPKMVTLNQRVQQKGQNGQQASEEVRLDMTTGTYDVIMDTGPGFETRREEGAEALLQLLNSPPLAQLIAQHGADLVFRSIDHPYMQELADRLQAMTPQGMEEVLEQLPERAQSFIKALMSQLQQMQQALQEAQMENKFHMAGKRLEAQTQTSVEASKEEGRRMDTVIRAISAQHDTELKVGGKILDTHVKAGHEAAADDREAQRLIQQGAQPAPTGSTSP